MKFPFYNRENTIEKITLQMLVVDDIDPFFIERIKRLRAKFQYRMETLQKKVVAVTSSVAGEGKTILSTSLAAILALEGRKKVLLIDMDLRNSELVKMVDIPQVPGLSEFIKGEAKLEKILQNSLFDGLHIIPCGTKIIDPGDLIAGKTFGSFIKEIQADYDFVIIDTPPVIPVSDALSIRELVDGYIFVVGSKYATHSVIKQAIDEIGENRVLGVIINGVALEKKGYYKQYYGKYYNAPKSKV